MNDATQVQQHRLSELEAVIERGQQTFIEVGRALTEIRDSQLYRESFATFEDYCKERWGWNASRARQLIGAAKAVIELESVTVVTPTEVASETESSLPVQNERQARELARIKDPVKRKKAWEKANEVAEEIQTAVTAKIVHEAVQEEIEEAAAKNGNGEVKISRSKLNIWIDSIMKIGRDLNTSIEFLTVVKSKHSIEKDAEDWTDKEVLYIADGFEGLQAQARSTIALTADLIATLKTEEIHNVKSTNR